MKNGISSVSVYYATGYAPMAEYTRFVNDEQWKLLKQLLLDFSGVL